MGLNIGCVMKHLKVSFKALPYYQVPNLELLVSMSLKNFVTVTDNYSNM